MIVKCATRLLFLTLMTLILFLGCTSSGGGDGDDGDVTPLNYPDVLSFQASGVTSRIAEEPGLTIAWITDTNDSGEVRLNPNPAYSSGFIGTLNHENGENTINVDTGIDVEDMNVPPLFNDFRMLIRETIVIPSGYKPSSGLIGIQSFSDSMAQNDRMQIRLNPEGVQIGYKPDTDGAYQTTENYKWKDFEDLLDDPGSSENQRSAVFAIQAHRFMMNQIEMVDGVIEKSVARENDLIKTGTFILAGDSFSDNGFLAPMIDQAEVIDPGSLNVSYYDANNDQEVSTGDTLYLDFNFKWDYDHEVLSNRYIEMINLVEASDGESIESVEFEAPGGIFFHYFKQYGTDIVDIILFIGTKFTINGGLDVMFEAL